MPDPTEPFSDAAAVAGYAERTARLVPGLRDLQKMTGVLVAERAPAQAQVLVVGAGGGQEISELAQAHAQWRFVGVDPSESMLALARTTLGPLMERVTLHLGTTETAPEGPFDAATCLLTMHFLDLAQRRSTLDAIRRRLKPGAPLVMAHLSLPQGAQERPLWLARYAAFAIASGVPAQDARRAASTIESQLPILGPEQEETLLSDAGFAGASLFYAGLAFRGWVAHAT